MYLPESKKTLKTEAFFLMHGRDIHQMVEVHYGRVGGSYDNIKKEFLPDFGNSIFYLYLVNKQNARNN